MNDMSHPPHPVDPELELLKKVQVRGLQRKLVVLTRLSESLDLPIEEHLAAIAETLARKLGEQ